jgi:hypothetical protein
MKNKNLHLVPQSVLDAGTALVSNVNKLNEDLHRQRLEVIRDYCQEVLDTVDKKKNNNK